jgi:hypothetical protein
VARVLRSHWLPSDWDTRRLLRFLAGLAMLAMAFAGPAATVPAPVAPSPAVVTTASAENSVTPSESASAPSSVRVAAGPIPAEAPATVVVAGLLTVLIGCAHRARGQRAPPAA